MTIDVFFLGGTGFPTGGDGISELFLSHLDERFLGHIVHYPAAGFGTTPMTWAQSRAEGKRAAIAAIRSTKNRAIIGGFSQGAGIAGDLAAEIGAGKHPGLEVLGCALIADPGRPTGGTMPGVAAAPGYGIVKDRPIRRVPTWWAAAVGDPITSLPAGSPLRSIADGVDYFSLASPEAALGWGLNLYMRAVRRDFQPWWSLEHLRDWGGATRAAWNYLPPPIGGGRHTVAYVAEGLCAGLARTVNREVR